MSDDMSDVERSHWFNGLFLSSILSCDSLIKVPADLLIFLSRWLSLSDYVHALQLMTDLYLAFKHVMCTKTHTGTHTHTDTQW